MLEEYLEKSKQYIISGLIDEKLLDFISTYSEEYLWKIWKTLFWAGHVIDEIKSYDDAWMTFEKN